MPKPERVVVIPAPGVKPPNYVRGIPASGKSIPRTMAQPLIEAGLVVVKEPEKKPVATKKESD